MDSPEESPNQSCVTHRAGECIVWRIWPIGVSNATQLVVLSFSASPQFREAQLFAFSYR